MTPDHSSKPVDNDRAEREALGRVAHALRHYRIGAEWEVARWEHNLGLLSLEHRALVAQMPVKIAKARQCIYRNHLFFSALLSMFVEDDEGHVPPHLAPANAAADEYEATVGSVVAPHDHDRVRYVLKNVARDWSEEGAPERAQSYGHILAELRRLFGGWPADSSKPPCVLVPGAGLARLCLEIVNLGFQAQGNEFSYHMLLASAYLLNGVQRELQWTLHPWVHNSCNQLSIGDQLRGVRVPDVHPAALVPGPGLLSMSAGDFAEVYAQPEYAAAFDAVAACFFLDTACVARTRDGLWGGRCMATEEESPPSPPPCSLCCPRSHNIIEYLQVIWHTLKPGGYLVNLGPLLYHWAAAHSYLPGQQLSVELSLEEVKAAALQIGFRLIREEMVDAAFLSNQRSMMQASTYHCAFWTMQKPGDAMATAPAAAAGQRQQELQQPQL